MSPEEREVWDAVGRGYPTNSQRKRWSEEQWALFNQELDARARQQQTEAVKQHELSNERLKERVDELERRLDELRQIVWDMRP